MAKVDAKHSGPNFWERLQPRERVLVMALVIVFFVMGTAVMMFLRFTKLTAVDEEIADIRQGLDLTRTFGPAWKQKLAKPKTTKIAEDELSFATLIESSKAVVEGITINGQREKDAPLEVSPGVQKRTYEFDLRNVTLDQLTKFLSTIEGQEDRVILTESLTIRSGSASEDRLTVNVVLATWEKMDEQAAEEDKD